MRTHLGRRIAVTVVALLVAGVVALFAFGFRVGWCEDGPVGGGCYDEPAIGIAAAWTLTGAIALVALAVIAAAWWPRRARRQDRGIGL